MFPIWRPYGGAAEGIRTPDPRITNALLYQLSYRGIGADVARFALGGKGHVRPPTLRPTDHTVGAIA